MSGPPVVIVVELPDDTDPNNPLDRLAPILRVIGNGAPSAKATACQGSTADAVLTALRSQP